VKIKYLSIIIIGIFFLPSTATATSPYGKIYIYDVYYNDKLLPGTDVAKQVLKIGEPFNIKVNVTVYQEYEVSGKLTELSEGYFEVIDGPSKMNRYSSIILMANESHIFEWTVRPTDKWAGGSMPIDFHYSFLEKNNPKPVLNSEFTVAYCTISTEHYKGEVPTSKEQTTSKAEPIPTSKPASMPAFSLVTAIAALSLVFFGFSRK
jgi:MAST domain-containing protein